MRSLEIQNDYVCSLNQVTIPALNDSQFIGMCIYNVVVLSVMGVVLAYVLILHVTLHYIVTSVILVLGTTMTQAIIFIPKVLSAIQTLPRLQ